MLILSEKEQVQISVTLLFKCAASQLGSERFGSAVLFLGLQQYYIDECVELFHFVRVSQWFALENVSFSMIVGKIKRKRKFQQKISNYRNS